MSEKELSEKHKRFIDKYFSNGKKAIEAYSEVYPKASKASVLAQSHFLLKKLEKTLYFLEKTKENRKKLDEIHGVNRDFLIKELKGCLQSAKEGDYIQTETGTYVKVDRQSWLKSVEHLIKMTGEYAETKAKLQISGTGEGGKIELETKIVLD